MNNREKKEEAEYIDLLEKYNELASINPNSLDCDGRKKLEFELLRNGSRQVDLYSIIRKNNITSCGEKNERRMYKISCCQ